MEGEKLVQNLALDRSIKEGPPLGKTEIAPYVRAPEAIKIASRLDPGQPPLFLAFCPRYSHFLKTAIKPIRREVEGGGPKKGWKK
jgi:hypothetical protein